MQNDPSPPNGSRLQPLVRVRGLKKHFSGRRRMGHSGRLVRAVDGLDLDIHPGETVGLVGESGCGKSTAARTILHLLAPTAGSVQFAGRDLAKLSHVELQRLRRQIQIVFQDPFASLNPRMSVGRIIREPLEIHRIGSRQERIQRVEELLTRVGLRPEFSDRYPHEFSGGQRQRIGIARALATRPSFIVADEPISALDVSIQAQIVNLFLDLEDELGLTYLFIAHDLTMIRHISDRVAVMYLGRIVEQGPCDRIFRNPVHPYTQALLSAVPVPVPRSRKRSVSTPVPRGEPADPANPPSGCRFHPRCPLATEICRSMEPEMRSFSSSQEHQAACHHA